MKIQTTNSHNFGKNVNVPVDGEISVDQHGFADVSDECAELLVQGTTEWILPDEEEVVENEELKQQVQLIQEMDLNSLIDFAKEAKIKGYQLFSKDESKLKKHIINKLTKQQTENGE